MVTRKVDVLDAMVHKWREESKMNMLTRGIHNPVKQRSPNNVLSVSYRRMQMSISHRAGVCLSPCVLTSLAACRRGICMAQIREACVGEHKGTFGKLLLPRSYQWFGYPLLHLTCPELQHLGQQQQAPLCVSI